MSKEVIKFLKVREVKDPNRAHTTDAGIDFYVPKFTKKFIEDLKEKNKDLFFHKSTYANQGSIIYNINNPSQQIQLCDINNSPFKFDEEESKPYFCLMPQERVLIPSGIHVKMPYESMALIANNKSGVASKLGLIFGGSVIDESYEGEIHINVINTSLSIVRIYEDMKIMQFIETPIFTSPIEISEGDTLTFYTGSKSQRKEAGIGSTFKK